MRAIHKLKCIFKYKLITQEGVIISAAAYIEAHFHLISIFCFHLELDKMYMWKLFAYKKIFAHGKIKRKEVHGKKEKKTMSREERKSTILSRNEKNSFVKATGTGRAPCWCPDWFWTKLLLNWNLPYIMLKMRFPFLYTSTSLKTKTSTIDSNHNFESCQLSCSSAHFPVFPSMQQVFLLPLALLLIIVSSSSMLHRVIKIKNMCLQSLTFPRKS